ncbi:unnamed protein product [Spirodela intermedia]|uniref:Uncharacterized protein n=1 Tax=Spirodela intermedia TaxID=51605 RepID=A0A7I8JAV2_SPIIN|nr:unnamed protein product [Spirodela intermedia]CAA6667297.1 unnamed protein product [Spirodela intermedia]
MREKKREKDAPSLSIDMASFELPSPLPPWPPGEGFAMGKMNLGEIEVCEVTSFAEVWVAHEGGPGNLGAAFFSPSSIPAGFFPLDATPSAEELLSLAGSSSERTSEEVPPPSSSRRWTTPSSGAAPDGISDRYSAVGLVVTSSPEKPSPEEIRCVRSELTERCEVDGELWSDGKGFNLSRQRPTERGSRATGVAVGTFTAAAAAPPLLCLKNSSSLTSTMPNKAQIEALVKTYSPWIFCHPKDPYFPSSVAWFFTNGATLHKKGDPIPIAVDPSGGNLPQGGANDGEYWLDVPAGGAARERILKGDLPSSEAYLQVKPMLGAPSRTWPSGVPHHPPRRHRPAHRRLEHLTLRISNFSGKLRRVYFSQHSAGEWVEASKLEFHNGNKPIAYASLHGHAMYPAAGLYMQGSAAAGIRNDAAGGGPAMDTGERWNLVAAPHLGDAAAPSPPPWLDYRRQWGPKLTYWTSGVLQKVAGFLPSEMFGEEGPTGPRRRAAGKGREVYPIVTLYSQGDVKKMVSDEVCCKIIDERNLNNFTPCRPMIMLQGYMVIDYYLLYIY